jgi:TRAP-type mannitol/chloroaromatic compound transport system permease small subunit
MGQDMNAEPHQQKPRLCAALDGIIQRIGGVVSWLSIALLVVIIVQVILRYVFARGIVILEELQWHFYGILLVFAISSALVSNAHIRLDLLHARFSQRNKEKVELFGILFLLLPMIVVIFLHSLDFFGDSWRVNERSDAPMGLCCRWAFKAFLPIGMGLFGMAAISRLIRAFMFLKKSSKESN